MQFILSSRTEREDRKVVKNITYSKFRFAQEIFDEKRWETKNFTRHNANLNSKSSCSQDPYAFSYFVWQIFPTSAVEVKSLIIWLDTEDEPNLADFRKTANLVYYPCNFMKSTFLTLTLVSCRIQDPVIWHKAFREMNVWKQETENLQIPYTK